MLYGAERILGLGDGEARPRLCVLTISDRFCGVILGDATGDSWVEDMREFLFDVGGYSELKDGASERAAEKSSYDCISERAPVVESVNDEPERRLDAY